MEELDTAKARGLRVRCLAGEFPGAELASELLISGREAGRWIDSATDLTTRLPRTLQGMSAGLIDAERGAIIASYTGSLSAEDAAKVGIDMPVPAADFGIEIPVSTDAVFKFSDRIGAR